jgi:hypothetical protein
VLEAHTGLYLLTDSGPELVFDLRTGSVVGGNQTGVFPAQLTDVAFDPLRSAVGAPQFVGTAENDGFSFGLNNSLLLSYFCYFPDTLGTAAPDEGEPSVSQQLRADGVAVMERTDAVAINPYTGQIFAQPRTTRLDARTIAGSELFLFEQSGGQPVATRRFERLDFAAGGMAVAFGDTLVLGFQNEIYIAAAWEDDARRFGVLEGVGSIEGMAVDLDGGLLVLDGPGKRLLHIESDEVGAQFNALSNSRTAP